jgi:hypothetical protein
MPPLFAHRFLLRSSLVVANAFAWIFVFYALFLLGDSAVGALGLTALLFATTQTISFVLTPLAGMWLINGARSAIVLATSAHAAALFSLAAGLSGFFGGSITAVWWGICGFVVLSGIYRAFYFLPYALEETATHSFTGSRLVFELFLALIPASTASVIAMYEAGPQLLLAGAGLFAVCAILPLLALREVYEPFSWSYGDTVRALFSPRHRPLLQMSVLNGIQGAGLLFLWPITAFLLLDGQFSLLGLVLSVTLLIIFGIRKYLAPLFAIKPSNTTTNVVLFSSWVVRFAAFSPLSIVIADALYYTGLPVRRFGMDIMTLEQAADGSHYIDEMTAIKEMGLSLGRALVAIVVAALFVSGSLQLMLLFGLSSAMIASVASLLWRVERVIA